MSEIFSALNISASALTAQRKRLDLVVSNIANAQTTRTEQGGPYRRQDVVLSAEPVGSFWETFLEMDNSAPEGVKVEQVVTDTSPPVLRYEPSHPDANEQGYVAYPNVNPLEEMANLMTATRSFEANVRAFETIKQILQRSIELGR